jgi:hypothetical protein
LCLLAMQGMLMLLNVSKRFKNLRIDNIFRKGWKERLLCPPKSGQALDSSSSLSSCKLLWGHTLVSVISFYWFGVIWTTLICYQPLGRIAWQ